MVIGDRKLEPAIAMLADVRLKGFGENGVLSHPIKGKG